ncbi:Carnitine transport permease protein OpuCB [Nocardia sp. RB20]|uniref:Carnitine transport permease protein OpuCB n=1 Tax=Nocardia macrotermitis TaxID=2585198 RepID=A0A7K0D3H5_9NOCA|nr:Carnitine transport permease protein OpuCB [Nocardia macrotermitis]
MAANYAKSPAEVPKSHISGKPSLHCAADVGLPEGTILHTLWTYVVDHRTQLLTDSYLHVSAVVQSVLIATVAAVLVGIVVHRSPWGSALATAAASIILTVPSFALLGLLIPVLGLGVRPTVTALVLYALLPILRNTIVGLAGVDPAVADAARGVGMNRLRVLTGIELPLAWPAILAGMRVSAMMSMGILAMAAYAKGPGLGNIIFSGLARLGSPTAVPMALSGTLLIIVLALLLDAVFALIGRLTTPRGIRD